MHKLLQRQVRRSFEEGFDVLAHEPALAALLTDVSQSYEELYKEKRFLEHTLEMNSEELNKANVKIKEQNRELQKLLDQTSDENEEMIHLLKQYKEAIDTSLIVSITTPQGVIKYVNDNFVEIIEVRINSINIKRQQSYFVFRYRQPSEDSDSESGEEIMAN